MSASIGTVRGTNAAINGTPLNTSDLSRREAQIAQEIYRKKMAEAAAGKRG